jgi:hypothetical protein
MKALTVSQHFVSGSRIRTWEAHMPTRLATALMLVALILISTVANAQTETLWDNLGGVDLIQAGVDRAPVVTGATWIIPAAAHVAGARGTSWVSEVALLNPGELTLDVELHLLGSDSGPRSSTLEPGRQEMLDDVILTAFGKREAAGAILVMASGPIAVSSRTDNITKDGTFGQAVPAIPFAAGPPTSASMVLPQLRADHRFRSNLGAVNLDAEETVVVIELYRGDGELLGTTSLQLPPFGFHMEPNLLASFTTESIADAFAVVHPSTTGARCMVWASIVDRTTGAPIFLAPALPTPHNIYIPAVASIEGANKTVWRSDISLINPGARDATVWLELLLRDRDNSAGLPSTQVAIPAGAAIRVPDVVRTLHRARAAGALRVVVEDGEVVVSSRTYTTGRDESFGQVIPAFSEERAIVSGLPAFLPGLRYASATGDGYRCNLGVVNLSPSEIEVTADLYRADGQSLGELSFELPPFGTIQENDILAKTAGDEIDSAYAVLTSTTVGARYLAFASVVSNSTGASVFVPAQVMKQ